MAPENIDAVTLISKDSPDQRTHSCIYRRLLEVTLAECKDTGCKNVTNDQDKKDFNSKEYTIVIHASECGTPRHHAVFSLSETEFKDNKEWTPRIKFRGYNVRGEGMVRVSVAHKYQSKYCCMVGIGEHPMNYDGWLESFWFYAYPNTRPGWDLEMISIGECYEGFHRCMVVQGKPMNYSGWTEKLSFWVPKF